MKHPAPKGKQKQTPVLQVAEEHCDERTVRGQEQVFVFAGASSRDRTGDLILTMDALYLLSYRGVLKKL